MRTLCLSAAIAGILLIPAWAAEVQWLPNFKAAQAQSRKTNKPVLAEFYADWCGPCKMMASTTFKDAEVAKLAQRFVPVRINADKDKDLALKYKAYALPYVVVIDAKGRVVRVCEGYRDAPGFSLFMRQSLPD